MKLLCNEAYNLPNLLMKVHDTEINEGLERY